MYLAFGDRKIIVFDISEQIGDIAVLGLYIAVYDKAELFLARDTATLSRLGSSAKSDI